ncbi:MAG: hypothetical protein JWM68_3285 [Verrucomicrobiales bacterium]|nr:hypothetical protein [Verrucomicrobiales bacterium]
MAIERDFHGRASLIATFADGAVDPLHQQTNHLDGKNKTRHHPKKTEDDQRYRWMSLWTAVDDRSKRQDEADEPNEARGQHRDNDYRLIFPGRCDGRHQRRR